MSKDKRPAPAPETTAAAVDVNTGDTFERAAAASTIEVGTVVTVWPHVGDRGCYSGHAGEVVAVHMQDCVDVKATVVQGDREFERTFVGVVLAGARGRRAGDPGTFVVG